MKKLSLKYDLSFDDFKTLEGLKKVDGCFISFLKKHHSEAVKSYKKARQNPASLTTLERSDLLLSVSPILENFLGHLFGIEVALENLRVCHNMWGPLWRCKRDFVVRRVALKKKDPPWEDASPPLIKDFQGEKDLLSQELSFATSVLTWLENEALNADNLREAVQYATWALRHPEGQKKHQKGLLFKLPGSWDFSQLIPHLEHEKGFTIAEDQKRERTGFHHTDAGVSLEQALDQAHYCIKCHPQGKDSCSQGLVEKGTTILQKNPLGNTLTGCPLQQKISEMNVLKSWGMSLAAFAVILIDNPLVAATGHRICNDCAKACIFQKQDPVDVPSIETQILEDVLALPWGFELYALLVRWNPLNLEKPFPEAPTGRHTLVVGMGPAGFTVAHYLLRDGHTVVGIDGLKIEPLPTVFHEPIRDIKAHFEDLDHRLIAGFGGVAEYGITVRWQKNYLLLIRVLLERQATFRLWGGVRFGSQLTEETSKSLGFQHIALCCGAGSPRWLPLKNGTAPGVRLAQDFLMGLQLTGASRPTSFSSLTIRMPIVVIGGGLTAIDAATEALAYYPLQVKKFSERYQELVEKIGLEGVRRDWQQEDHEIAQEFLAHAHLFAQADKKPQDILEALGGAAILYRKDLSDAPSYRLNHEEVFKALQEGVKFLPEVTPQEVMIDAYGHAKGLKIRLEDHQKELAARTILIATGTTPNTQVAEEYPSRFRVAEGYLKPLKSGSCLISQDEDGQTISHFGDLQARYAGSVVKAMASAKQGASEITESLLKLEPYQDGLSTFMNQIEAALTSKLIVVKRLTPTVHELIISAPAAAQAFQPGQFFRLQNYETLASRAQDHPLVMESMAVRGAWVDKEHGLIHGIVFDAGASSLISRSLKPGDPLVFMGPTGSPLEIPHQKKVLLIGEGHGNTGLLELGKAMKKAGNEVHYLMAYPHPRDVIYQEKAELTSDVIYWSFRNSVDSWPHRPQDHVYQGSMIETLQKLAETEILRGVNYLLIMASSQTMAAVEQMLSQSLLNTSCTTMASVNAPMQCMMKGVCGQCLQRQVDPFTGQESMVLSCQTSDQPLEKVDFESLQGRLQQNRLQEKVNALWLRHLLKEI